MQNPAAAPADYSTPGGEEHSSVEPKPPRTVGIDNSINAVHREINSFVCFPPLVVSENEPEKSTMCSSPAEAVLAGLRLRGDRPPRASGKPRRQAISALPINWVRFALNGAPRL